MSKEVFQCPTSGFFLFYAMKYADIEFNEDGFNALLRASFFSTDYSDKYAVIQWAVSMPYFGLLSFLLNSKSVNIWEVFLFQCPTSGFFLFYRGKDSRKNSVFSVSMPYFGLLSFLRFYK